MKVHGVSAVMARAQAPPPALLKYLQGSWKLRKRLEYRRGGGFGTWTGTASFTPVESTKRQLMYSEEGELFFDGSTQAMRSAGRPLLYDFEHNPAKVYFVEGETYNSLPPPPGEGIRTFRFFHDLPFSADITDEATTLLQAECSFFDHLCVADLYKGTLCIADNDSFQIEWNVQGPTKDGSVSQSYRRLVV